MPGFGGASLDNPTKATRMNEFPGNHRCAQTEAMGAVMELFLAKKVASVEDQSSKICRFCNRKLILVRTMVEYDSGVVVHMFECRCGERIWKD
jgi:hypothetical protein